MSSSQTNQNFEVLSPKHYTSEVPPSSPENESDEEKLKRVNQEYYHVYKEALDFALSNQDVTNIGLTGGYGSGKSSIIQSYLKNEQKEYISISLAHFSSLVGNNLSSENTVLSANSRIDNVLEAKIVNQLIHQIKPKNIPKSNIRIKKNDHKSYLFFKAAILSYLVLFFSLITIIFQSEFKEMVQEPLKNIQLCMLTLLFIASFLWFVIEVLRLSQESKRSHKFSFKFMGLEYGMDEKDISSISYFDNFLDDVVYLFDNAGKNIVVFEDLDRFPDVSIFEKLREINFLVNQQRELSDTSEKLKFIYVVKDDIFTSAKSEENQKGIEPILEKTKFFDIIIPVVSPISSSNSFDYLKQMLLVDNEDKEFETIVYQLSIFIDDFRVLKNIVNEYNIYYRIHFNEGQSEIGLDQKKLFTLIVYKNLNYSEFLDLSHSVGDLYKEIMKEEEEENNG